MKTNIGFIILIFSFFYSMILNIIFHTKKHINTVETSIFGKMAFANFLGIILEMMCITSITIFGISSLISLIINKVFLLYFIVILYLFMNYVINTVNSEQLKNKKIIKNSDLILKIILIISVILLIFLKINLYNDNGYAYSYGPAVILIYTLSVLTSFFSSLGLLMNFKTIKSKKNLPIIAFILLMGIAAIIQQYYPQITLATSVETFVIFLMYFTIENPDVKMLNEIEKNRELTEKSIEDKANMLFKITEDVKTPVSKIEMLSNKIIRNDELEEIHADARNINGLSRSVNNTINNVMDITNYDIANLKVSDISYDMNNLFKELVIMTKEQLNDNIEFSYHMSSTIPNKLYGDSLKIKQIIYTIII